MIIRTMILCGLMSLGVIGCNLRPTLEQLEDDANTTGDWTAVERREELIKESLEMRAPGCLVGRIKKCFETQSGIECFCLPSAPMH